MAGFREGKNRKIACSFDDATWLQIEALVAQDNTTYNAVIRRLVVAQLALHTRAISNIGAPPDARSPR